MPGAIIIYLCIYLFIYFWGFHIEKIENISKYFSPKKNPFPHVLFFKFYLIFKTSKFYHKNNIISVEATKVP